jgi:tetratricopeptide (TPR) repeat protein
MEQVSLDDWDKWMLESIRAWDEGRFADSANFGRKSASAASSLPVDDRETRKVKGYVLTGRAELYGVGGIFSATCAYEQALEILDSTENIRGKDALLVEVLYNLAEAYSKGGKTEKANPLLERAMPISKRIYGESSQTGKILYSYGLNKGMKREFDTSILNLNEAGAMFLRIEDYRQGPRHAAYSLRHY